MDEPEDRDAGAIGNAAFVLALRERGVRDTAILRAMERVPRERFAPARFREHARRDIALPLPCGQTMTAPTQIAAMLGLLDVAPGLRVLEIGTGSGYVTGLLAELAGSRVRSLERSATLARAAGTALASGAAPVEIADGLDAAVIEGETYERILVNGVVPDLPRHLGEALAPGGRLVGALSVGTTRLVTIVRAPDGRLSHEVGRPVRLTPLMPGRAYR